MFREVYSGDSSLGSFDYVMVKHKPLSSEIVDFAIIEFQTVDTTNTGELNRALAEFMTGADLADRSYGFGLNWANVWKRCFIQILNKGRVIEHWGHKAFWVVQEPAYQYFLKAYGLATALEAGSAGTTTFMVYDLLREDSGFVLQKIRMESTTVTKLLEAFGTNPNMPSKEQFIERLGQQSRQNVSVKLDID